MFALIFLYLLCEELTSELALTELVRKVTVVKPAVARCREHPCASATGRRLDCSHFGANLFDSLFKND